MAMTSPDHAPQQADGPAPGKLSSADASSLHDRTVSGKAIVIPVALVLVVAIGILAAYKLGPAGEPTHTLRFERADEPAANATVLPFDAVHKEHKDSFLEDHLDTTLQHGASLESEPLRVDRMLTTLTSITGSAGPEWVVAWQGVTVVVTMRTASA